MWIVGGAIRDYFLKKEIKDIDFAINIDINVFIKSINKTQIKVMGTLGISFVRWAVRMVGR